MVKEMVGGCCVCSDERGWDENPLVYCDGHGCNVAVHQACYGIVQVPKGPWFCRKCESQERIARVKCELCPSKEGALKRTDTGGWAHVVCALYIPEVRFGNVTSMEPIILASVQHERFLKACYICELRGKESRTAGGACIQCNKTGCRQSFHVTCGQHSGLLCEESASTGSTVKYVGYCTYHWGKLKGPQQPMPQLQQQQQTVSPQPTPSPTASTPIKSTLEKPKPKSTEKKITKPRTPNSTIKSSIIVPAKPRGRPKIYTSKPSGSAAPKSTSDVTYTSNVISSITSVTSTSSSLGSNVAYGISSSQSSPSTPVAMSFMSTPPPELSSSPVQIPGGLLNKPMSTPPRQEPSSPMDITPKTPVSMPLVEMKPEVSVSVTPLLPAASDVKKETKQENSKVQEKSNSQSRSQAKAPARSQPKAPRQRASSTASTEKVRKRKYSKCYPFASEPKRRSRPTAKEKQAAEANKQKKQKQTPFSSGMSVTSPSMSNDGTVSIYPIMTSQNSDILTHSTQVRSHVLPQMHHQNELENGHHSASGKTATNNTPAQVPSSLEQLLEMQWEQGANFFMQQASHFDVATLLSCLHQLKADNKRLNDKLSTLTDRRNRLLTMDARLSVPMACTPSLSTQNEETNKLDENSTRNGPVSADEAPLSSNKSSSSKPKSPRSTQHVAKRNSLGTNNSVPSGKGPSPPIQNHVPHVTRVITPVAQDLPVPPKASHVEQTSARSSPVKGQSPKKESLKVSQTQQVTQAQPSIPVVRSLTPQLQNATAPQQDKEKQIQQKQIIQQQLILQQKQQQQILQQQRLQQQHMYQMHPVQNFNQPAYGQTQPHFLIQLMHQQQDDIQRLQQQGQLFTSDQRNQPQQLLPQPKQPISGNHPQQFNLSYTGYVPFGEQGSLGSSRPDLVKPGFITVPGKTVENGPVKSLSEKPVSSADSGEKAVKNS